MGASTSLCTDIQGLDSIHIQTPLAKTMGDRMEVLFRIAARHDRRHVHLYVINIGDSRKT